MLSTVLACRWSRKEEHCAICQKSHQNGSVDAALALFVASSMNSGFVKSDCDHGIMTAIKLSRHPESRYKCTSAFTSMLGSALQRRHGMVTWILLGKTRQDQKWRRQPCWCECVGSAAALPLRSPCFRAGCSSWLWMTVTSGNKFGLASSMCKEAWDVWGTKLLASWCW